MWLVPCPSIWSYKEDGGLLFAKSSEEKATGKKNPLLLPAGHEEIFSQWEQSIGIIQGGGGFPSAGHFYDAGLPCLDCAFAMKSWARWSLRSHPTSYSLIPWFSKICVSGHTHWCAAALGEALVPTEQSSILTPASLAGSKDFQRWLCKLSWKWPHECCQWSKRWHWGHYQTGSRYTGISLLNVAAFPTLLSIACVSHDQKLLQDLPNHKEMTQVKPSRVSRIPCCK